MKKTKVNPFISSNLYIYRYPRAHGKITGMPKEPGFIESVVVPAFFMALAYTILFTIMRCFLFIQ